MFTVGPYLFSGEVLAEALSAQREEARTAARDGAEDIKALFDRFRVADTKMHVDRAYFAEERPLTDEEAEAIAVPEADRATYKAITIAVPYSGDPRLFTHTPTIYSAHQPQAEVGDGLLRFTWFLGEAEEFQLENNFKRTISLVERTLEVTQWQAMDHNESLMAMLRSARAAPAS